MAVQHTAFFDSFPTIKYDINRSLYPVYEDVTNVFFRIGVIRDVLNNVASYYVYDIQDGDTPEIIAEKVYGDSGAGWMVLLANNIIDPQFDWPLDYKSFDNYIIGKYGSLVNAKTTVHHAEKVIVRTDLITGLATETHFDIDHERLTEQEADLPYNYYTVSTLGRTADATVSTVDSTLLTADEDAVDTPRKGAINEHIKYDDTYQIDGKPVRVQQYGRLYYCYDYELEQNDKKRQIKIIKKEYYSMILDQFRTLTGTYPGYIRRLG